MSFLDSILFWKKPTDFRLVFLYIYFPKSKDTCLLSRIHIVDILPEKPKRKKKIKIPKVLLQVEYDATVVPLWESILNKTWHDDGNMPDNLRTMQYMIEYVKVFDKIPSRYRKKINGVLCGVEG